MNHFRIHSLNFERNEENKNEEALFIDVKNMRSTFSMFIIAPIRWEKINETVNYFVPAAVLSDLNILEQLQWNFSIFPLFWKK